MDAQQIEVKVKGEEIPSIFEYASRVSGELGRTSGLTNVNLSMDVTRPEYLVFVDRTRASALGMRRYFGDRVETTAA